jgi:hypothetical protein
MSARPFVALQYALLAAAAAGCGGALAGVPAGAAVGLVGALLAIGVRALEPAKPAGHHHLLEQALDASRAEADKLIAEREQHAVAVRLGYVKKLEAAAAAVRTERARADSAEAAAMALAKKLSAVPPEFQPTEEFIRPSADDPATELEMEPVSAAEVERESLDLLDPLAFTPIPPETPRPV